MGFATDRIAVPSNGWVRVDTAQDTDTIGLAQQGGQGLVAKNSGSVQVLIADLRQIASKSYPLDPSEAFPVDLEHGNEVYARAVSGTGELAIAQVGVTVPV